MLLGRPKQSIRAIEKRVVSLLSPWETEQYLKRHIIPRITSTSADSPIFSVAQNLKHYGLLM